VHLTALFFYFVVLFLTVGFTICFVCFCMYCVLSFLWTPGRLAVAKASANGDPINKQINKYPSSMAIIEHCSFSPWGKNIFVSTLWGWVLLVQPDTING